MSIERRSVESEYLSPRRCTSGGCHRRLREHRTDTSDDFSCIGGSGAVWASAWRVNRGGRCHPPLAHSFGDGSVADRCSIGLPCPGARLPSPFLDTGGIQGSRGVSKHASHNTGTE